VVPILFFLTYSRVAATPRPAVEFHWNLPQVCRTVVEHTAKGGEVYSCKWEYAASHETASAQQRRPKRRDSQSTQRD